MSRPLSQYLRRAIDLLSVHNPAALKHLSGALRGLRLEIASGDEYIEVSVRHDGHLLVTSSATPLSLPSLRLKVSAQDIVDLVSGQVPAETLLRRGTTIVVGSPGALMRGGSAFRALAEAGVRSRAFHRLFEQFQLEIKGESQLPVPSPASAHERDDNHPPDSPAIPLRYDFPLLVFDVGGVLIRRVPWQHAYRRAGICFDRRPERQSVFEHLFQTLRRGLLGPSEFFQAVSALCGQDHAVVERAHAALAGPEYAGAFGLVETLIRAGCRLGILSNIDAYHWHRVRSNTSAHRYHRALPLLAHRFPESVLLGHTVGALKPDTALFDAFERKTGCAGQSVVLFDDNPVNLAAATRFGWTTELITPNSSPVIQIVEALRRRRLLPRNSLSRHRTAPTPA